MADKKKLPSMDEHADKMYPPPSLAQRMFGAVVKGHPLGGALDKAGKALEPKKKK